MQEASPNPSAPEILTNVGIRLMTLIRRIEHGPTACQHNKKKRQLALHTLRVHFYFSLSLNPHRPPRRCLPQALLPPVPTGQCCSRLAESAAAWSSSFPPPWSRIQSRPPAPYSRSRRTLAACPQSPA